MAGYEDLLQRAADYQSIYAGNKFQCMRTADLNDQRLGEIFSVKRIEPSRNNIVAVLSDGSTIPVELLNSNFSMITTETPPLPKGEVRAMHARLKGSSDLSQVKSDTVALLGGEYDSNVPEQAQKPVQAQQQPINIFAGLSTTTQPQQIVVSNADLSKQLFGMFTLSPTDLEFSVPVKLPTLDLIQMMYAQASDKDEFITNFSTYVMQNIDLEAVKKAMSALMEPKAKKIRAPKN